MSDPDPPVNIRLRTKSGEEIPADSVYVGFDGETHKWAVVTSRTDIVSMTMDKLPAHTSVALRLDRRDGFSLIEVLCVLVIVGILICVTFFAVAGINDNPKDREEDCRRAGGQVQWDRNNDYAGCLFPRETG